MADNPYEEWQAIFDRMDEHERHWKYVESIKVKYIRDARKSIANTITAYLFQKVERPDLFIKVNISPLDLRFLIMTNEQIRFIIDVMFDDLYDYVDEFYDCDCPEGRKLWYKKIEYRLYSEERVLQYVRDFEKRCPTPLTPAQRRFLYKITRDDEISRDYEERYSKMIHDELKRLAVKYFPEIGEITPTGSHVNLL